MLPALLVALLTAAPENSVPLRLRAAGDVMLGTDFPAGHLPPEDGAQMLASVKELLADADLTFVNLEGPLCDGGQTKKCRRSANCYAFRCPTRYVKYLVEAGVDVVSTANNHSGDFGEPCRRETERALDEAGIRWSGPPGSIATLEAAGKRIAVVAFHTSASCNHLNDFQSAAALVEQAAQSHDWVIVSFHGGAEGANKLHVPAGRELFHGEDRGDLRAFTHRMIDAGADLVLGHGPHVARAMEVYKDRLIAYSMGNFATYGRFDLRGPLALGMVLEVELEGEGRFVRGRILPTLQLGEGVPQPDSEARVIAQVRRLSAEDFPQSAPHISADGVITVP